MSSGIYYIINKVNKKKYIGSSKNIEKRFKRHKMELRNSKHHNIFLQRSYNKHGLENFEFSIVEETDQLFEREQFHINCYDKNQLYNVGSVGGGDNTSNHPNIDVIKIKVSDASKKMWDNRSLEEREKFIKYGKNNPNYGKKWTKEMRERNSKIAKQRYKNNPELLKKISTNSTIQWQNINEQDKIQFKEKCKQRMLTDNPFKGKRHNTHTLHILSEKGKARFEMTTPQERYQTNPQTVLVNVCGVLYYGLSEASRQLGISPSLMLYRLKSKSEKWKDYQYVSIDNHSENGNDILG